MKQDSVSGLRFEDFPELVGVNQPSPRIVTGFISGLQPDRRVKAIVRVASAAGWLSYQLVVENLPTNQWLLLHKFREQVKRLRTCLPMRYSLNLPYLK
jgi:hypothetical protein